MEPHGQRPCLHTGVPAFAETLRAGRRFGTQACSPTAGMKKTLFLIYRFEMSRTSQYIPTRSMILTSISKSFLISSRSLLPITMKTR